MNVILPEALVEFVEKQVASGAYSNASEVVADGLRRLKREKEIYLQKVEVLRREIQLGIDDIEAGRIYEGTVEDILEEVRAEQETLKKRRRPPSA
jgi:antitoxin ParD1/3/4